MKWFDQFVAMVWPLFKWTFLLRQQRGLKVDGHSSNLPTRDVQRAVRRELIHCGFSGSSFGNQYLEAMIDACQLFHLSFYFPKTRNLAQTTWVTVRLYWRTALTWSSAGILPDRFAAVASGTFSLDPVGGSWRGGDRWSLVISHDLPSIINMVRNLSIAVYGEIWWGICSRWMPLTLAN